MQPTITPDAATRAETARANAAHSTGPRTPDGKARSSQNARTHGLTAQHLVIAPEDQPAYNKLVAGLVHDIRPHGELQQTLFNELTTAAWNLQRIRTLESELDFCALDDDAVQKKLERLARHRSRCERTFHRSLRELKALQTERTLRRTLPEEVREGAAKLASPTLLAKRSQDLNRQHRVEATQHRAQADKAFTDDFNQRLNNLHRKLNITGLDQKTAA